MGYHKTSAGRAACISIAPIAIAFLLGCGGARVPDDPSDVEVPLTVEVLAPPSTECNVDAAVRITIRPNRGLILTSGYPMRLTIHGPAEGDTTELRARDAAVMRRDEAAFVHGFRPTEAGTARFEGVIDYSVCSETSCVPGEWPVAWEFPVECDDLPQ